MQSLLYLSYKIEPFFYKILSMSIVATLIGFTIILIKNIFKKQITPKWINRIWLIFIISLILPMQFKSKLSIYNYIPLNFQKIENTVIARNEFFKEKKETNEVDSFEINKNVTANKTINEKEFDSEYNIIKFVPLIWILISGSCFSAYVLTYIYFEKKIHNLKFENEEMEKILVASKEKLKINRKIILVKQDIVSMPAIFGIFNIRILINDNILNLNNKEKEYVFLHELGHYKRKDNILNIIITILKCIYYFNPVILLCLKEIKNDLELATDELIMENEDVNVHKDYSKTLLKTSILNSDKFLIQTMCLSDNKRNLKRRINSIKMLKNFRNKKTLTVVISIICVIIIVCFFYTKNSGKLSAEEIVNLLEYGNQIEDIYYEEISQGNSIEKSVTYKKKDILYTKIVNKESQEILQELWQNIETKEAITIDHINKNIQISTCEELSTVNNKFKSFFKDLLYKYEYLRVERENNKLIYVVMVSKDISDIKEKIVFFVDSKTGLISKVEIINESENNNVSREVLNFNYKFDELREKEIEKPDISQYREYTITNN